MKESNSNTSISISTNTMIRAVLVALGVFLLWYLSELVMIILTAIVLASFVESTLPYFKKIRVGRVWGVVIFYLISALIFTSLFYLFAPLLITEVYNFSNYLSSYIPNSPILNYFQSDVFSGAKDVVANITGNISLKNLLDTSQAFISNLSGGVIETLSVAFGSIFNVVLIVIISFYLSIEERGIEKFLRIILPLKYEDYAVDLWGRTRKKIALWIRGQMLLGILVAILIFLLLSLLGTGYALLLAIIAGVMELIPYGIMIALIPAFSFSYISGGLSDALMVTGAFLIIHQFEVYLFAPLIIKKVVGLSPFVIIISAIIGYEIASFWGVILAIPLSVLVVEMMSDMEKNKFSLKANNEQK